MTKKSTLKHMQENGHVATRSTARTYTHVLLRKVNNSINVAALTASREKRLAEAVKYARRQYAQNTAEIAAGVGGQIPYWPGQGGCDGSGRTHEQPEYQFNSAVEYMQKHGDVTGYVTAAIAHTDECLARDIKHANSRSEEWQVISWHSRAGLAKPDYIGAGDLFKVEAINGGVRATAEVLS